VLFGAGADFAFAVAVVCGNGERFVVGIRAVLVTGSACAYIPIIVNRLSIGIPASRIGEIKKLSILLKSLEKMSAP